MKKQRLAMDLAFRALVVFCVVYTLSIRFSHPNLTETRLFMEFFWEWIGVLVVVTLGGLIHGKMVSKVNRKS